MFLLFPIIPKLILIIKKPKIAVVKFQADLPCIQLFHWNISEYLVVIPPYSFSLRNLQHHTNFKTCSHAMFSLVSNA